MSAHARYEAMLGALALGEALPAEREELAGHARACAACAADLDDAPRMHAAFAAARDAETWRPASGEAFVADLRERRVRHARVTVGALGWAAALSIALNATFASGLGERVLDRLRDAAPAVSSTAVVRPPARPAVPNAARVLAEHSTVRPAVGLRLAHAPAPLAHAAPRLAHPAAPAVPSAVDVPDVLAGLDLYGRHSSARSVALEAVSGTGRRH